MSPYDQLETRINKLEVEFSKAVLDIRTIIEEIDQIDVEACYNRLLLFQVFLDACEKTVVLNEDGTKKSSNEVYKIRTSREYKRKIREKLDKYAAGERPLPNYHDDRTFEEAYEQEGDIK